MNHAAALTDQRSQKLLSAYVQMTGSCIRVFDHNCRPLSGVAGEAAVEENICKYCPVHLAQAAGKGSEPCLEMHTNAVKESNRSDGIHIYTCKMGLMFWTSPLFYEGSFLGALRGSGYLKGEPLPDAAETTEEFLQQIKVLPRGDGEKIKSMAEIMLICAASLSFGSEDYHEVLRRRTEQQRDISAKIEELKAKKINQPAYPVDKERLLIGALHRGDAVEAANVLNDILALLLYSNTNQFKYIQLRAVELAVMLSRVDIASGQKRSCSLQANYHYLSLIKEAKSFEELTDTLHSIVKRISGIINSFRGIPHAAAMRKAERYIKENFTRKISLSEIASVAGLSAPYFSTIFREEMGENLSKYLNRLRVEKAARMLLETDLPISDIVANCCFEDQSWFSKIFKSFTGISPGKYRARGGGMVRDISENNVSSEYLERLEQQQSE